MTNKTTDVELIIAEALLELCKNRKLIIEHDYYNKKKLEEEIKCPTK